jgi:hypothetical protein
MNTQAAERLTRSQHVLECLPLIFCHENPAQIDDETRTRGGRRAAALS